MTNIFVAGSNGMVGSSIVRILTNRENINIISASRNDLDLTNQLAVENFFKINDIDVVINCAAVVGGILANNNYPVKFLLDNMQIQNNLIGSSIKNKVDKFIFLGSSCIYPKFAEQPIVEESLLTSTLEETNQWYAIAKISGVKLIEACRNQFNLDYVSLMPTNLYGPHDNFDIKTSHVLPAMIRKFHNAKIKKAKHVNLWGSGKPFREFLHVDDLARAVQFTLDNKLPDNIYNVGYGKDISIMELALLVKEIIGFNGKIIWDKTKPDGTPKKLMDSSKLNKLGWKPNISLNHGIKKTYNWFLQNQDKIKEVTF